MRLIELLNEDISRETSLRNIIDILTTEIPELYRSLGRMADNYFNNHGVIDKGFYFVLGSPKSNWFQSTYLRYMKPALYSFAKSLPRNEKEKLSSFLSSNVGNTSFSQVETQLLNILLSIGQSTKNNKLVSAVNASAHAIEGFNAKLNDLSQKEIKGAEPQAPSLSKNNTISQQNQTVVDIINHALSRLDQRVAGEIRNAISRKENKLLALQQELNRRGIRLD